MKIYRILLQIIVITIISTTVFMIDPETSYACSCVQEPTVQEEMQNKTAPFFLAKLQVLGSPESGSHLPQIR